VKGGEKGGMIRGDERIAGGEDRSRPKSIKEGKRERNREKGEEW
jgi:hypothetical protein